MADDRWLVVGLGNPGERYAATRHNVGADAVRVFADRHGASLKVNKRTRCEVAEVVESGVRFAAAVPTSYMNESGGPVQAAAAWFKVPLERIVVCHDDLDLPVGSLRVKRGGGNAGHNGLKDLDRAFGSPEYLRVRLGVGRPPGRQPARDHVLRRFTDDERRIVDVVLEEAADAIVALAVDGVEATQNRYHRRD